jgi:hypothetical protein
MTPLFRSLSLPLLTLAAAGLAAADVPKAALPADVTAPAGKDLWVPSGYMGANSDISMDLACAEKPHDGATACTKVTFGGRAGTWGGVVWQSPQDDWGLKAGGFDLTGATKLVVWARGKDGGEKVKFGFGVLGKDKPFPDSDKGETEFTLTTDWKEYDLDLAGKNLSDIKTGFEWATSGSGSPVVFYLSQVHYEK